MFNYCTPIQLPDLDSVTHPTGKRFYSLPDGTELPSVTTVLGSKKKESIEKWRKSVGEEYANKITQQACSRGTRFHSIAENYLNNDKNYLKGQFPDAVEMFKSIKPILDENVNDIYYQEQALYSKSLGMAGRVDLIAHYDGILSVIDFKTSSRIKSRDQIQDYFSQCTAYSIMHKELVDISIKQVVIIMAVADEKPLVFVEKTIDHIKPLLESIKYYKSLHE